MESFEEGDFVVIKNGWCKDYRGELQISSGRYGKIDLVKRPEREKKEKKQIESLNSYLRPTIHKIRK